MKDNIKLVILPLYRVENDYSFSVFNNLENNKNTLSLESLENNLSKLHFKFNFYGLMNTAFKIYLKQLNFQIFILIFYLNF